jgi:hypothetical protein
LTLYLHLLIDIADEKNPFQLAIDGLLSIKTTYEPNEKLKMIAHVAQLICDCIDQQASGKMMYYLTMLNTYADHVV